MKHTSEDQDCFSAWKPSSFSPMHRTWAVQAHWLKPMSDRLDLDNCLRSPGFLSSSSGTLCLCLLCDARQLNAHLSFPLFSSTLTLCSTLLPPLRLQSKNGKL